MLSGPRPGLVDPGEDPQAGRRRHRCGPTSTSCAPADELAGSAAGGRRRCPVGSWRLSRRGRHSWWWPPPVGEARFERSSLPVSPDGRRMLSLGQALRICESCPALTRRACAALGSSSRGTVGIFGGVPVGVPDRSREMKALAHQREAAIGSPGPAGPAPSASASASAIRLDRPDSGRASEPVAAEPPVASSSPAAEPPPIEAPPSERASEPSKWRRRTSGRRGASAHGEGRARL